MYRAMLWKEVREQAAILVALLVLGSGVIAAATALGSSAGSEAGVADFRAYTNAGRLAVLSLAVAAGVVVGGTLFAGEKENGTLGALEMLPATRRRVWWGKLAAGVTMAFAAGVVLLTMGTALGALGGNTPAVWLMWGLVLVFVAFGWGAFGSTVCETTLAACATGLIAAVVVGTPVFVAAAALLRAVLGPDLAGFRGARLTGVWLEVPALLAMYAVAVFPVVLSGWVFTAPDRARYAPIRAAGPRAVVRRPRRAGPLASLKALLWLTNRQWYVASAVGAGLTLLAGVSALHEDLHLMAVWPFVTTLAAVFAGVLSWADEQSKDTYKFWGERRLPLGRLWAVKVATSLALAVGWTALVFAPSLVRQLTAEREPPLVPAAFRSGLLGHEGWGLLNYLFLWPAYGFAFGHVAGLLFRKTIVALGVGLLTAAPVAALWLPSLLTGGVHGWQLWPVPLVVLLATRGLMRPWAADRLARLKPLAALAAVGTACAAWTAFGLVTRFQEVPVAAEIDEDLTFADAVPQLDNDDGGRGFRQTTSAFRGLFRPDGDGLPRGMAPNGGPQIPRTALAALPHGRWADEDLAALGQWLDSPTLVTVEQALRAAADKPLGPIDNPRGLVSFTAMFRDAGELSPVVTALLARGLWKQRRGDDAAFAGCLDAALAATRNARTMQPGPIHRSAYAPERQALDAVDEWLHRAAVGPGPVRGVLAALEKHDRHCPRDLRQVFLTERMIDRLRLTGVSQWAPQQLEFEIAHYSGAAAGDAVRQKANLETELLSFSLAVPWERERFRRLLGLNNAGVPSPDRMNRWLGQYLVPAPTGRDLPRLELVSQATLAVTLTQVRLRLFELDTGRAARSLDELVPRYCGAVPRDPYDGKPLRYRVSDGERVRLGVKAEPQDRFPLDAPALPVGEDERAALSGAVGGLALLDRPLPVAPGLTADGVPLFDLDALAAVAGGLSQAALEPVDDAIGGGAGGAFRMAAGRPVEGEYFWREVAAGQGIVWSVGPDLADDEGKVPLGVDGFGGGRGDVVRVVPGTRKSR